MTPATTPLVLDTNVVLDWLVFKHACGMTLEQALHSGRWQWTATAAMRQELDHVLSQGVLERWQPDRGLIRATCRQWAVDVEPVTALPLARLRCSDPDDQKFVDLALQLGRSTTLLSRDRAVLKLARRAAVAGVSILTPEQWQAGLSGE